MSIVEYSSQISKTLENLGLKEKSAAPADPGGQPPSATPSPPTMAYGNIGHALLNVPFPEMVKNLGTGIADAQYQLDMMGARMAQLMAGMPVGDDGEAVVVDFGAEKGLTLFELGFSPSFYQFTETLIDLKMTLSYASETVTKAKDWKLSAGAGYSQNLPFQQVLFGAETASVRANVSTMSTENMAKYNIKAEGTSSLSTTLVVIPPPPVLEERIRQNLEIRQRIMALVLEIERTGVNSCDLSFEITQDPEIPELEATNTDFPESLDLEKEEGMIFEGNVRANGRVTGVTMLSGDRTVEDTLSQAIRGWRYRQVTNRPDIKITVTVSPSSELSRLLNLIT